MVKSFQITAVICLLIQILGFILYFQKFVLIKIFPYSESKIKWKKTRDNFILGLSICFFILSYLMASKIGFAYIYVNYIFSGLVLLMTLLMLTFYLKKFKTIEIAIQKIKHKKHKYYVLKWKNKEDLKIIYGNLEKNNFIEFINQKSEILDYDYFANLLFDGKVSESPAFKLNMDNIQTKYFFDLLSQHSTGFTFDHFLKIFKNKNMLATRNSIEASYSTAKSSPKRKQEIDSVFTLTS